MKKVSLLLALAALAGAAHATLVFDDMSNYENGVSGAGLGATGSTPNTFMGDGYTLLGGTTSITGFDVVPVNLSGTSFTGLQGTIYVWGTVNTGTVSATAPAFSNLLGSYTFTATGAFTTGFYFPFESATPGVSPGVSLVTPLAISGTTIGVTMSYQGTTDGVNYASATSLTSVVSYGTAPTVGSESFNGYYRNANSETNGNFTSSLRSLGYTNQSLALRVYGNVQATPEPSALAALGLGAFAMLRRRKRA